MKSADVIKNYYARKSEIENSNSELAAEIKADEARYTALNEQYKEYVRTGKDNEADTLLDDIQSLESTIKKKDTRLKTKRSLVGETLRETALETLAYAKNVKDEYQPELDKIDNKVVSLLAEVNELLNIKSDKIEEYNEEYSKYVKIYDDITRIPDDKAKEFIAAARNGSKFRSVAPSVSRLNSEIDIKLLSNKYNKKAGNQ